MKVISRYHEKSAVGDYPYRILRDIPYNNTSFYVQVLGLNRLKCNAILKIKKDGVEIVVLILYNYPTLSIVLQSMNAATRENH